MYLIHYESWLDLKTRTGLLLVTLIHSSFIKHVLCVDDELYL